MNNVLAQNATDIAVSASTPENYPFAERVAKIAERKVGASGLTRSSVTVNRNALMSGVCADFRNTFPSLFAKRDDKGNIIEGQVNRVPDKWYDVIVKHIDEFIDNQFERFTKNECKVSNTRFVHQGAKKDVILRHTLVRDEIIALQEQKLGIMLFIGETKRQIDKLNNQSVPLNEKQEERLQKLEKRQVKENETLNEILAKIALQKPAEAIVKTVAS